jgi:hypothetical protein
LAQEQFLDIWLGENRTLSLQARDNANNPSDLTGKTVTWAVGFPPYEPDWPEPIITKTGTVTDAAGGLYTVAITPTDTKYMAAGNYTHQAYTTDNTGSVSVVTEGTFRLRGLIGWWLPT